MLRQIALHIQTTGYEARRGDRIIEIAAIEYVNGVKTGNKFVSLINPEGKPIDQDVDYVKNITDEMLLTAPTFAQIATQLFDFIKNDELIVHNSIYISTFIDNEMSILAQQPNAPAIAKQWLSFYLNRHVIDVMPLDQKLFPKRIFNYSHALNEICYRVDVNTKRRYCSENRAEITMEAYQRLAVIADRRRHVTPARHMATLFSDSLKDANNPEVKKAARLEKRMRQG